MKYKYILALFVLTLFALSARAEKRWYRITSSKEPAEIRMEGEQRVLRWRVKTDTRFDGKAGDSIDLDASPYLTQITSKEIIPVVTSFRHADRKSTGDPKREFLNPVKWEWQLFINYTVEQSANDPYDKGRKEFKNFTVSDVYVETAGSVAPTAGEAIAAVLHKHPGIPNPNKWLSYIYDPRLVSAPPGPTVARYHESIIGFGGIQPCLILTLEDLKQILSLKVHRNSPIFGL